MKRTSIRIEGECWVWTKSRTANGYGTARFEGHGTTAHRVVYTLVKGPVPDDKDLDHLCRNRLCVNPDHLEIVDRRENLFRGLVARGCKNGHPYSAEGFSIVRRKDGTVENRCKLCHRLRNKNAKRRRRELEELL
jgi:hypothetical protein